MIIWNPNNVEILDFFLFLSVEIWHLEILWLKQILNYYMKVILKFLHSSSPCKGTPRVRVPVNIYKKKCTLLFFNDGLFMEVIFIFYFIFALSMIFSLN